MERRPLLQASAGVLAAPSLAAAQPARVRGFIPQADPTVLDPIWTNAHVTRHHSYPAFDTLYGQDSQVGLPPEWSRARRRRMTAVSEVSYSALGSASTMASRCWRATALPASAGGRGGTCWAARCWPRPKICRHRMTGGSASASPGPFRCSRRRGARRGRMSAPSCRNGRRAPIPSHRRRRWSAAARFVCLPQSRSPVPAWPMGASPATARARMARRTSWPVPRSRISTGWCGSRSPIPAPWRPCRRARWIGWSSRCRTCCRCCAGTRRFRCSRRTRPAMSGSSG